MSDTTALHLFVAYDRTTDEEGFHDRDCWCRRKAGERFFLPDRDYVWMPIAHGEAQHTKEVGHAT